MLDDRDNFAARGGVENLVQGREEKPPSVRRNDGAGKKSSPVVRALPFFTADERKRDPNERRYRSQGIGAVMPCVGLDRSALDIFPEADHGAIKEFLHRDYDNQDDEGERRRPVVGRENFPHALNGERDGSEQHAHGHEAGRERLRFSVTVGMRPVRRARREFQASPDDDRAGNIERGLDSVRDQHIGITEQAR